MWTTLNSLSQLDQIRDESNLKKILIYKHSSRCSISRTVLDRLERNWKSDEIGDVKLYFLDLLSFREISTQIETLFDVEHESPQVLIISKGHSVYNRSHLEIDYQQIKSALKS
jgi:bacillithiol system protein YtxJ